MRTATWFALDTIGVRMDNRIALFLSSMSVGLREQQTRLHDRHQGYGLTGFLSWAHQPTMPGHLAGPHPLPPLVSPRIVGSSRASDGQGPLTASGPPTNTPLDLRNMAEKRPGIKVAHTDQALQRTAPAVLAPPCSFRSIYGHFRSRLLGGKKNLKCRQTSSEQLLRTFSWANG